MLDEHDQLIVIRGLRDGRRDAWTALYDGYSTEVWRYVGRLIGASGADVGDVVQETFLAAACAARQFDSSRGSLWCWLAGIAHHQAAVHWRKQARGDRLKALAESGAIEMREWWAGSAPVDDVLEQHESAEIIRGVLSELPAEYAALLTAKYLDEQSLGELAARFGGSVEAIKSKLARARREFREKFESLTREPKPVLRESRDAQA